MEYWGSVEPSIVCACMLELLKLMTARIIRCSFSGRWERHGDFSDLKDLVHAREPRLRYWTSLSSADASMDVSQNYCIAILL